MKLYLTRGNLIQMKLRIFFLFIANNNNKNILLSNTSQTHEEKKGKKRNFFFLCVLCKVNDSIARLKLITSNLLVSVGDLPRMNVHMVVISGHTGRICTYV